MSRGSKKEMKQMKADLDAILRRVDRFPVLDSRTPDEILAYDEHGLPQSDHSKPAPDEGDILTAPVIYEKGEARPSSIQISLLASRRFSAIGV
jgi:hypothetical protein